MYILKKLDILHKFAMCNIPLIATIQNPILALLAFYCIIYLQKRVEALEAENLRLKEENERLKKKDKGDKDSNQPQ